MLQATPVVRKEQVCSPPDEGWRTWVLLGGRGAAARISALEGKVAQQALVAERLARLARLEAQGEAMRASLERIERQLEGGKR